MIYKWETEKERLLRFMKIPPEKKLEWLREINEFNARYLPKKTKAVRERLRKRML